MTGVVVLTVCLHVRWFHLGAYIDSGEKGISLLFFLGGGGGGAVGGWGGGEGGDSDTNALLPVERCQLIKKH